MKTYSKRFLAFFLSLMIVISSTQSAYAATSIGGWSLTDSIIAGATTTIEAIRTAGDKTLKSTIGIGASASKIGARLIKGGGSAALAYAVVELLGEGVEWVLDPANNAVKYKVTNGSVGYEYVVGSSVGATASDACRTYASARNSYSAYSSNTDDRCYYTDTSRGTGIYNIAISAQPIPDESEYRYLPISAVASKVINNAAAGHAPSQEVVKATALEGFAAGEYDAALDAAATDVAADNPPDTDNPPVTDPAVPFDPSSIIAAIKSVMAAVVNMSGILGAKIDALMIDIGLKHDEQIAADAANTAEIVAANDRTGAKAAEIVAAIQAIEGNNLSAEDINAAVQSVIDANAADTQSVIDANAANTAAISAAIEAIDGNTLDGQVINDAIDRAIAAGNANAGDIVAAVEAIEGNTLDGQVINDAIDRAIAASDINAADIVAAIEGLENNTLDGQVINDAIDRVIANDNANAAASKADVDAKSAADAANTAAVTDAIDAASQAEIDATNTAAAEAKEAADAKAAADAAALEWAKEAPEAPTDTGVIVDEPISDFDSDKSYITFTGGCPPKYTASLNVMGATAPFEFDYTPICTVMSYLKPFIVGAGYIAAAYIIAGHSRGSKD